MARVVFAGGGKTDNEIRDALTAEIGWFNVESEAEFENISRLAGELGVTARAALRINPGVSDPKTHTKTNTGSSESKFGVPLSRARAFFERFARDPRLLLRGLHTHIGSPIYGPEPYVETIEKILALMSELSAAGHSIEAYDIGGGFMANYTGESQDWQSYADAIVPLLLPFKERGGSIILEPGRTIAANSGILLTRVQYKKQTGTKTFVICDAGMSHHLRPALYDAYHFIWPTRISPEQVPTSYAPEPALPGLEAVDIVGPICESSDVLAKNRALPPVERGTLLSIFSSGAYGMTMASQYNSLCRPAEVLVDGDRARLIRRRDSYEDLVSAELDLG